MMDDALEQAMAAEASARADSAAAQASNLASGRRADEQAVVREQLAQARSTQQRAARDLQRQQDLVRQGFVSGSALDAAQTAAAQALARVRELEAALRVTTLPARTPEREAADASARAATEVARQVDWRLGQKHLLAPVAGRVEEVYFQVGETVAPGQPVLSLLPPGAVKARFYVPEADLPRIRTGMQVSLSCDGCGAPLAARVVRVATEAEYTPPVIYSNAQRARLVFMVEARPLQPATALRPGMPLDVHAVADAPRAP